MASSSIDLYVDEAYLLALIDDELIPISDENYAQELQVQEALFSSLSSSKTEEEKQSKPQKTEEEKQSNPKRTKIGESSQSKPIFCGICMEAKQIPEIFDKLTKKCKHDFCNDCVAKYIATKIKENIASVQCPDPNCNRVIEPEDCTTILPKEVFNRWENALCESIMLGYQKFYCPFKDCSVLLIDDGEEKVTESECPSCNRMFCAQCRVGWHVGVTCEVFQGLENDERERDDLLMMKLANDKQWRRCSNCRFYVEKTEGCLHMTCRCRYQFCYKCGSKWSSDHSC